MRIHLGDPGDVDGSVSRVLLDVARRTGARSVFPDSSAIPHAVEVEPAVLPICRAIFGLSAVEHRGKDDQHRDTVRVRYRLRRRMGDAGEASWTRAAFLHAVGSPGADPGDDLQLCADVLAGSRKLAAARDLAGDRSTHLFRV